MHQYRLFIGLSFFCTSMAVSYAGPYQDADAAIAQNRHVIAYQILLPLAEKGEILAKQKIARLERDGHGRYEETDDIVGLGLPEVPMPGRKQERMTLHDRQVEKIESLDNVSFEELMAKARELSRDGSMNFVPSGDVKTEAARRISESQPKPFTLSESSGIERSNVGRIDRVTLPRLAENDLEFDAESDNSSRNVVIIEEASEAQKKINAETLRTLSDLQRKLVELDEKSDLRTRMVEIERAKRVAAGNEKRRNLEVKRITARIRSELHRKISAKYEARMVREMNARVVAEKQAWDRQRKLDALADRKDKLDVHQLNSRFRRLLSGLDEESSVSFLSAQQELLSNQSSYLIEQYLSMGQESQEPTRQLRKQVDVGMAFFKGVQAEQNNLHAFAWWQYAALQGSAEAKINMGIVKTRMTRSEKERAMRFTKELTAGIL